MLAIPPPGRAGPPRLMGADGKQRCPVCGAVMARRELRPGQELRCRRCGSTVRRAAGELLAPLCWALATTGLIVWGLAVCTPILTFEIAGREQSNWIWTGIAGLAAQGYWPVAVLVFFSAMAAPVLHLAAVWYVSGALSSGGRWPGAERAARLARAVAPWSLTPVFAVACGVAVVKLEMLGRVEWHQGAFWVLALAACSFALARLLDDRGPGEARGG